MVEGRNTLIKKFQTKRGATGPTRRVKKNGGLGVQNPSDQKPLRTRYATEETPGGKEESKLGGAGKNKKKEESPRENSTRAGGPTCNGNKAITLATRIWGTTCQKGGKKKKGFPKKQEEGAAKKKKRFIVAGRKMGLKKTIRGGKETPGHPGRGVPGGEERTGG